MKKKTGPWPQLTKVLQKSRISVPINFDSDGGKVRGKELKSGTNTILHL